LALQNSVLLFLFLGNCSKRPACQVYALGQAGSSCRTDWRFERTSAAVSAASDPSPLESLAFLESREHLACRVVERAACSPHDLV
jgi:hypothetical protein